ncbi:hypothetical protein PR003_g25955 [Phytophthora rubi]|uniref:Uncharacterized protein n=1 Tax=Phytophthora rubi TaxID=129364 RepID=A0A6A4CA15_9STRA|nr:hypothetical protein PR003_g25955 [Phytophthora rubi]
MTEFPRKDLQWWKTLVFQSEFDAEHGRSKIVAISSVAPLFEE